MRGTSFWTAGEREYLAMVTAQWQQCPFCATSHTEMIRIASTGEVDPNSGRPELLAVATFLEKVTRSPASVSAADLPPVPDDAIVEALQVNLVWNVVNRLANVFEFQLRPGQLEKGTRALHRFGYRFPGFLTNGGRSTNLPKDPTFDQIVTELRDSVLDAPARTTPAIRRAAATGSPVDEPWMSYAATVRDDSRLVTDADIASLTGAGHTEDEIFEVTVAAALGAALRSLDAGLDAMRHKAES
jgi:AhpD family alkylhydroperoxidase